MHPTHARTSPTNLIYVCALIAPLALGACTTTGSQALLPTEVDIVATHPHSLSVKATGTSRRFGFGRPFVPSDVLQTTVEEAILQYDLFKAIAKDADYVLQLELTELTKPESGLDMTAGITMRWSLADTRTEATLWIATLTTAFTASTVHSSQLDERLRTSIEGALRENIELGLHQLSGVELPGSVALE